MHVHILLSLNESEEISLETVSSANGEYMKSIKAATDINFSVTQAIKQTIFLADRVSSQSKIQMTLLQM